MTRILALVLAMIAGSSAMAEPVGAPLQIGRVASVSGAVVYQAAAEAATGEATLNLPLTTGNRIATPPQARATVDIAAGRIYLDGDSAVAIGALGPGSAAIRLEKGAIVLRILPGGAGQVFVIETPRGKLRADQPGYYAAQVGADAGVAVSALEGGAQFDEALALPPGTRAVIAPDAAPRLEPAIEDDFIRGVAAEIAAAGEDRLGPPSHVSPQATGFQELRRHGLWISTTAHGWVWEPTVASDWAPFQNGRWVEISPLGRTWIDNAAWAFAPSHYGNWTKVNGRWVWVPGSAAQTTAGVLDPRAPSGRWVALGPEEPHFTASPVIVTRVRVVKQPAPPQVVNNTTINNTTNVTTVIEEERPSGVFVGGFAPSPPPPSPPPSAAPRPRNLTGLGATGAPVQRGVTFPGMR